MAKYRNTMDLNGGLHIQAAAPIDDRMVVDGINDLFSLNYYAYDGMVVNVMQDGLYRLKDKSKVTTIEGWEKIGGVDLTNYALKSEIPTTTSQLGNDSNFISKSEADETYAKKGESGTVTVEEDPIWTSEKENYYVKNDLFNRVEITAKIKDVQDELNDGLEGVRNEADEKYQKKEKGMGLSEVNVTPAMRDEWNDKSYPSNDTTNYATQDDIRNINKSIGEMYRDLKYVSDYNDDNGMFVGNIYFGKTIVSIYVPKFARYSTNTSYKFYFEEITLNGVMQANSAKLATITDIPRNKINKLKVKVYAEKIDSTEKIVGQPEKTSTIDNVNIQSENKSVTSSATTNTGKKEIVFDISVNMDSSKKNIQGIVTDKISFINGNNESISITLDYVRLGYGLQLTQLIANKESYKVGIFDKDCDYDRWWSNTALDECKHEVKSIYRRIGENDDIVNDDIDIIVEDKWYYYKDLGYNNGFLFGEPKAVDTYDDFTTSMMFEKNEPTNPIYAVCVNNQVGSYVVKVKDFMNPSSYEYFLPLSIDYKDDKTHIEYILPKSIRDNSLASFTIDDGKIYRLYSKVSADDYAISHRGSVEIDLVQNPKEDFNKISLTIFDENGIDVKTLENYIDVDNLQIESLKDIKEKDPDLTTLDKKPIPTSPNVADQYIYAGLETYLVIDNRDGKGWYAIRPDKYSLSDATSAQYTQYTIEHGYFDENTNKFVSKETVVEEGNFGDGNTIVNIINNPSYGDFPIVKITTYATRYDIETYNGHMPYKCNPYEDVEISGETKNGYFCPIIEIIGNLPNVGIIKEKHGTISATLEFTKDNNSQWTESSRVKKIKDNINLCLEFPNDGILDFMKEKIQFEGTAEHYTYDSNTHQLEPKFVNPKTDCHFPMKKVLNIKQDDNNSKCRMEFTVTKDCSHYYRVVGCECSPFNNNSTFGFFTFNDESYGCEDYEGQLILSQDGHKSNCKAINNYYPVLFTLGSIDTNSSIYSNTMFNEFKFTNDKGEIINEKPLWFKGDIDIVTTSSGGYAIKVSYINTEHVSDGIFAEPTTKNRSFRVYFMKNGNPYKGHFNDDGTIIEKGYYITIMQQPSESQAKMIIRNNIVIKRPIINDDDIDETETERPNEELNHDVLMP